ncbi:MAG: hypothetical protein E6J29_06765 [Chloroflexi bacterium]|nr:MAG: hypothetical protein E6J29_06765 [Chloroflexota bacterium]TMD51238.1 MAG: hypothetical protein E6I85_13510 [Chloroflexota bacterium]
MSGVLEAGDHIRRAIALVDAVSDGPTDQEITPSDIAEAVRDAIESAAEELPPQALRYLDEALDAVSDGMPGDYVAMSLYAALGVLGEG